MSERTAVYRLYDAGNALLYIGVTGNPDARFAHHESLKPWWPDVARKEVAWYDSRKDGEAAETAAIEAERPRHNVRDNPDAPKPRPLEPDEILVGAARVNLSDLVARVRLLRQPVTLVYQDRARTPRATLVPADLGEAIREAGGPDAALALLRRSPAAD